MAALPYLQFTERLVGAGHPSLSDTTNRALRALLSQSGYDPDASPFPGLMGPVFNVKAEGAAGDEVANDAPDIDTSDTGAADGGIVWFPRGRFLVGAQITKAAYSDWIGVRGVDPGNRTAKHGTVLVAGFDGGLVAYPVTGSLFASYSGIRGISFYSPGLGTYPNAIAISSNGNVRQVVIEDALIDGFNTGISGPWGELYVERVFIFNTKYGILSIGASDSWISKVHAGSGLAAPAGASGGAGFLFAGANSITFDRCRGQVQKGGSGFDFRACTRLILNKCFADTNELYGVLVVNCNEVELNGCIIYDNGTVGANSKGIRIEAVSDTFTAGAGTDEITITGGNASLYWSAQHGIVEFSNSGGALPTGLAAGVEYYLIAGSAADKFKVAASHADAVAGTAIDITGAGSGTNSILGVTRDIRIIGGAVYDRNPGLATEQQDIGIQFVKTALNGAADGIIRNITLDGVDLSRVATPVQYTDNVDSGLRITKCPGIREDLLGSSSDATYRVGQQAPDVFFNNAFAADVNITLSQDGAYSGAAFNIARGVGATGAFNLVIKRSTGSTLATIAADATNTQMVRCVYFAGSTNQWVLMKSAGF